MRYGGKCNSVVSNQEILERTVSACFNMSNWGVFKRRVSRVFVFLWFNLAFSPLLWFGAWVRHSLPYRSQPPADLPTRVALSSTTPSTENPSQELNLKTMADSHSLAAYERAFHDALKDLRSPTLFLEGTYRKLRNKHLIDCDSRIATAADEEEAFVRNWRQVWFRTLGGHPAARVDRRWRYSSVLSGALYRHTESHR